MLSRFRNWLNHRVGLTDLVQHALYEPIPGGARFRYVTGSVLVFAFVTQVITGMFLWMAYSPSSQTAYESTWYIQNQMTGGWLLRGVHHFTAQVMVVAMALHMLQVIWDGAYRAPREVNYWLGLILLQLVLGLGLTGYLLPWDQKGFWATNVATNLATLVPVVGKDIQQLAVGGNEYGHHTLTRFFALHAGVLPALLVLFLVLHVAIFRRHGITAHVKAGSPTEFFWPRQVLFDVLGGLVLLTVVMLLVIHFDFRGLFSGNLPAAHRGAELGAPADPGEQYAAARPEWYYLFLFQLLKYFPGSSEIIGAIVIPGVVMTVLFLLPFIGRFEIGHRFNQAFIVLLLAAVVVLTGLALFDDYYAALAPKLGLADERKLVASREFLEARDAAERDAHRTDELINRRERLPGGVLSDVRLIPKDGAVSLLRNDPLTRGPRLFAQHCSSCHANESESAASTSGAGILPGSAETQGTSEESFAPNLHSFASRAWIKGLLDPDKIGGPSYFGNTAHKTGRMATWLKQNADLLKEGDNADAIAAALSAQAQLPAQREADEKDADLIRRGVGLIEQNCTRGCHKFGEQGQLGLAPDLTGYGSYEWMLGLASDPTHERFYRHENDRMPSFAKDLERPERHNVSVRELSLIVDWIRGQYFRADDTWPVLPHNQATAEKTVVLARTTGNPRTTVVGAATDRADSDLQKAQRLFAANCAACHGALTRSVSEGLAGASAPNLTGFGSREWLTALLNPEHIKSSRFFGNTRHAKGEMVGFVNDNLVELDQIDKTKLQNLIIALSTEAALPAQAEADQKAASDGSLEKGRKAMGEAFESSSCVDCHKFRDQGDLGAAPDLTGWASKGWLVRFITDPTHEAFYRETNDRMPSFGKAPEGATKQPLLTSAQIELIARLLRGEL